MASKSYLIVNDEGSVVGQLQLELPDIAPEPPPPLTETLICTEVNVRIRAGAGLKHAIVGYAQKDDVLAVELTRVAADGYYWAKITAGQYAGNYIADEYLKPLDAPDPSPELPLRVEPPQLEGDMQLTQINEAGETYTELAIDGQASQPNIGVNTREMAMYWNRPVSSHPAATIPRWTHYASNAKDMGIKWFRLFATHADLSLEQTCEQLEAALNTLAAHGHKAVICLVDAHGITGLHPPEMAGWFTEGTTSKLNKGFYYDSQGWEEYLATVGLIVESVASHPAVGAWQLMNEPDIRPQPASSVDSQQMLKFFKWATEAIWNRDKTHPIFLGLESSYQAAATSIHTDLEALQAFAYTFYAQLPLAHVSFHAYQSADSNAQTAWVGEANALRDIQAATYHRRLCWCTEFGSRLGNRLEAEELFLLRIQLGHGVELALRWAYMDELGDTGNGDAIFGFDPVLPNNKTWFYSLRDKFHDWNTRVLPRISHVTD